MAEGQRSRTIIFREVVGQEVEGRPQVPVGVARPQLRREPLQVEARRFEPGAPPQRGQPRSAWDNRPVAIVQPQRQLPPRGAAPGPGAAGGRPVAIVHPQPAAAAPQLLPNPPGYRLNRPPSPPRVFQFPNNTPSTPSTPSDYGTPPQSPNFRGSPPRGPPNTPVGGSPASSYGTPAGSWGSPASSYGTPAGSWGSPASSWGTPASSYGTPAGSWGSPASSYGTPAGSCGTPSSCGATYGSSDSRNSPGSSPGEARASSPPSTPRRPQRPYSQQPPGHARRNLFSETVVVVDDVESMPERGRPLERRDDNNRPIATTNPQQNDNLRHFIEEVDHVREDLRQVRERVLGAGQLPPRGAAPGPGAAGGSRSPSPDYNEGLSPNTTPSFSPQRTPEDWNNQANSPYTPPQSPGFGNRPQEDAVPQGLRERLVQSQERVQRGIQRLQNIIDRESHRRTA